MSDMSDTNRINLSTPGYRTSRDADDMSVTNLLRDVAFNRRTMNDGHHVSPLDNGKINIGADGINVRLVQPIDEEMFKRVMSMATRATIGLDLDVRPGYEDPIESADNSDWEEMLKGGLQTVLETQTIIFAVSGVSRTCTHQLVRSRKAAFHQQSQRASYYGDQPEVRMPESVWLNKRARLAFIQAVDAAHTAYRIANEEDISYQDARFILPEGTDNYIMLEYSVREFMNVYAYRGCSMFSWEIVAVMRECRRLLIEAHPWLAPYVKISCQSAKCTGCNGDGKVVVVRPGHDANGIRMSDDMVIERCEECAGTGMTGNKCTFQGWETVEGQCEFPWAKEELRTFKPSVHKIERKA
jgi:flavin-dependent thymidylate synthase